MKNVSFNACKPYPSLSCHVMVCHAVSCLIFAYHVSPNHISSRHVIAVTCLISPCHVPHGYVKPYLTSPCQSTDMSQNTFTSHTRGCYSLVREQPVPILPAFIQIQQQPNPWVVPTFNNNQHLCAQCLSMSRVHVCTTTGGFPPPYEIIYQHSWASPIEYKRPTTLMGFPHWV